MAINETKIFLYPFTIIKLFVLYLLPCRNYIIFIGRQGMDICTGTYNSILRLIYFVIFLCKKVKFSIVLIDVLFSFLIFIWEVSRILFCYWFFTKRKLIAKVPAIFVNLKQDGLAASIFLLKIFPLPASVFTHKYVLMSNEL